MPTTFSTLESNSNIGSIFEHYLQSLGPEQRQTHLQAATADFESSLRRIAAANKHVTWERPDNSHCSGHTVLASGEEAFLTNVLPLKGLQFMASLSDSFDVSLLEYYRSALEHYRKNDAISQYKNIVNLQDILESVEFLLNQKTIQEQLKSLPKEGTPAHNARTAAFSQEKFNQLLFLCQGTNLKKGGEIFEQNREQIQTSASSYIRSAVIPYIPSDALFQWYVKKWRSQHYNDQVRTVQFFSEVLNYYIQSIGYLSDNSAGDDVDQKQLRTVTTRFKSSLEKIYNLDQNITWKGNYPGVFHRDLPNGTLLLLGVLPLAGLEIMASLRRNAFDLSLLEYYRLALAHYLQNSNVAKGKTIANVSDILNSVQFLLSQPEIQEKLSTLPKANGKYDPQVTQEKFAELLFLCRAIGGEHGAWIFDQHESKIQVTATLLTAMVLWPSNDFESCIQRLHGHLPEGVVGELAINYTKEREQFLYDPCCTEERKHEKEREALDHFELNLSRLLKVSAQQPIVCTKEDFQGGVITTFTQQGTYIRDILPVQAIALMKEKFHIQLNPALSRAYLNRLLALEEWSGDEESASPKIENYDALLKAIQFLIKDKAEMREMVDTFKTPEDFSIGFIASFILNMPEFYESLYQGFCQSIQNKTPLVQEYAIAYILYMANKYKNREVIKLLSSHICTKITPQFLKLSAEINYYEGLNCLLEQRPEFLDQLPISNKMLDNGDLAVVFQRRLNAEAEKQGIREKELAEIQIILKNLPDIYVADMVSTIIRIAQFKRVMPRHSTQKLIELEFGASLSLWDKNDMPRPETELIRGSESLLGSFYGYKPELYEFVVGELTKILSGRNLQLYHKRFCFNLAVLFPNKEEVKRYLEQLLAKKNNSIEGIIFEAANFKIPTKGYWNIDAWFAFVKRNNFSPRAMAFLRAASDLDMKMQLGKTIFSLIDMDIPPQNNREKLMVQRLIKEECETLYQLFSEEERGLWDITQRDVWGAVERKLLWEKLIKQCPLAYEKLIEAHMLKKLEALELDTEKLERLIQENMTVKLETLRAAKKQNSSRGIDVKSEAEFQAQARKELAKKLRPLATRELTAELRSQARKEIEKELFTKKDKCELLLTKILDFYDLGAKATVESLVALRMQDFPGLSEKYHDAVVTALENGYSNEDVRDLITQIDQNKQIFTFVPSVVVEGREIDDGSGTDYSKYELRALEKTDPMALVAGCKTRCCQHLNGAGMESAMHAYNSVYGATYRLAAKKDPNATDWLAQSWTALSECGTILLFDSIEFAGHANEKMVLAAFKKLARKLLEQNPHLQKIWVGASQHARFKLEKHGYTRKPKEESFSIAGYPEGSYTDADEIVVLVDRNTLKEEMKQVQEEIKVATEYQVCIRYGVDTYLHPRKVVKLLGLSDEARELFNRTHASLMDFLRKDDPQNPLVEEGFVSSENDQSSRYREGEYSVTYEAVELFLKTRLNPRIEQMGLKHHVYASTEQDISSVLQKAKQQDSIDTFSVIAIVGGRHAVSVFVDCKRGVSFILDSEPGSDLSHLIQALKSMEPTIRVITPDPDLRLQKDYYSCKPFAIKSARFYAKHAEGFSQLLQSVKPETNILTTDCMPAALLKMAQTLLTTTATEQSQKITPEQQATVVSQKKRLTLLQYYEQHRLKDTQINTAALKTRYNVFKQISAVL